MVFGIPTVLTALVFARGNRSIFVQLICFAIGLLLAATLPLERIEIHSRFVRGWTIALTVVALFFLPSILAFLLVPSAGAQRRLRWLLYLLLAGVMVAILAQTGAP